MDGTRDRRQEAPDRGRPGEWGGGGGVADLCRSCGQPPEKHDPWPECPPSRWVSPADGPGYRSGTWTGELVTHDEFLKYYRDGA